MKSHNTPTKSTTRGILIFAFSLIVCFIFPDILRFFQKEDTFELAQYDNKQKEKINRISNYQSRNFYYSKRKSRFKSPPSKFNPNLYTLQDWMYLGLSEKQAAVVLKFTKYPLHSNADLKKIFVISDELFVLLKDSTIFSEREPKNDVFSYEQDKTPTIAKKCDINTASEEELQKVNGIGPYFAKQIVKKREQLGGYHHYNQLMEIWKVTDEQLAKWSPFLELNMNQIKKFNINTASAEEMSKHPYFSWNVANSIVKIREQNGPFSKIENIKKSRLITNELFEKLKPYLTL